jgi:hypothetical protein
MFRRLSRVFAALSIVIALAACGGAPVAQSPAAAPTSAQVPPAAGVGNQSYSETPPSYSAGSAINSEGSAINSEGSAINSAGSAS